MNDKATVRAKQLTKLNQYYQTDNADLQVEQQNLLKQLFQSEQFLKANIIATSVSMAGEFDTKPIIAEIKRYKKQVVIPRTMENFQMEFVQLNSSTKLVKTKFGVFEPVNGKVVAKDQIDLMIIPGLAFTTAGDRLGFGAGFYDRYLADYGGQTVALSTKPQYYVEPDWPVNIHDVKIQRVITNLKK